jgi:hypothetical protein
MGWWKVQGTENVIGDAPLEALEGAVTQVLAEYRSTFCRLPTQVEWQSLLRAVLGGQLPEERESDGGWGRHQSHRRG